MDQEHKPNQTGKAEPTIDQIKQYDACELLQWFEDHHSKALTGKSRDKFEEADIDGATFLRHAGDSTFFEKCNLPIGTCSRLANLALETAQKGKEQETNTGKSTDHAPCCSLYTNAYYCRP